MSKEDTPISKYLAGLERRQALLTPSPAPDPAAIIRKINFEDTYFHGDQSLMHMSVSPSPDARQGTKRKRLSILGEAMEDEENRNKKLNDLERLLQQTQGELIEARAMNTKLEHQISQIRSSNTERILGYEKSENEMRMKMRDSNDQVVLLKEQVSKLSKKEEELQENLHRLTQQHCEKMKSIEDKLRTLETDNFELRGKFESGTLRQSDELRKLNASLEETEMGAEKWVMETQLLRDQLELKDQQLRKYQNEVKEAQLDLCKLNELKAKYESASEDSSENLLVKIKYFENLYAKQQGENIRLNERINKILEENQLLRSTMNKEMLLEEQICVYEEEVRHLRKSLEDKAKLDGEKCVLEAELQSWKKMAFRLDPDCTNPMKFESYIRKIQNQLLEARHESATLKHEIVDRDRLIARGQSEINSLKERVKGLCAEKDNISQDLKKSNRRLILVTKDRDGLKDLKESYEQEFEGVISKPLQERINQLEQTVAEYEALIQEDPSRKKSCGDCENRMALISELRNEMDRLKNEKTEMESRLSNMSMSITMGGAGETSATAGTLEEGDTTGVKIVSFGVNPSALSIEARLKEAIKESEELKEKIKQLQEGTVNESTMGTGETLRELEEQHKALERKHAILTEAYDFETQQLQLIVSKLCGFHFTLVREPTVQIRLSSVYSREMNDTFIFQESPNGDMLLLESPILDSFREDIDRFLIRDGSIPGFLSSVTITYVQNQNAEDPSQLPASQQEDETATTSTSSMSIRDPREVQVEVTRQRRPTINEEGEDEEDEEEHDDQGEDDLEEEGPLEEEEMMEEEEDEHYDEEEEHYDEDEEDDEPEQESPPPQQFQRRAPPQQIMRAPARAPPPPADDDSDDSDIIMIDD